MTDRDAVLDMILNRKPTWTGCRDDAEDCIRMSWHVPGLGIFSGALRSNTTEQDFSDARAIIKSKAVAYAIKKGWKG